MKKTKKWLLCGITALSLGLAFSATACSSDDKNDSSSSKGDSSSIESSSSIGDSSSIESSSSIEDSSSIESSSSIEDSSFIESSSSAGTSEETQKAIALDAETVTMNQFDSVVLTYTLTGISATTPVTWTSSDPTAVSVENGKLTAYKTGTYVITVSAGGYSDTVNVTVEASNDMPSLTLSQTDAKILIGKTVTVYPEVIFRGEAVSDQPDVAWTTTSDAITLSPKSDGSVVITAVKSVENAIVQAKATYFGKEITNAVLVTVVEDVSLSLSASTASLYTYTYGEQYSETATLAATVTSNGETVNDASIEWTTDDAGVATVANGVVTVAGVGEATITAKYVASSGKEYTAQCIVTVSVPRIDTGKSAKIYLDNADGDQSVDIEQEFGISDTTLSYKVVDVATDSEWATTSGKDVAFQVTDKKLCGERAIKLVVDGRVELNATLVVVTKKIGTADELLNMRTYGEVTDRELVEKTAAWDRDRYKDKFYGYFELTADIDLSNAGDIGEAYIRGDLGDYGMIGGLDGQGHTIFGGRFTSGGLFGGLNKNGVIRNVAFMNTTLLDGGGLQGAFGTGICGLVENVLLEVTSTYATQVSNVGGFAEWVSGTIRNCVVYHPVVPNDLTSGCLCVNLCNGGTLENIYVFGGGKQLNYNNESDTSVSNIHSHEIDAVISGITFDGLTGDYWKFDGEKVYFSGCEQMLKNIVAAGTYPENMTNGDSAELSALPAGLQYQLVIDEAFENAVTLDGNTLTISNEISQAFSFQITVSKWNGIDMGVCETVSVEKIENIVVSQSTEYELYLYSATEKRTENTVALNADLSDELSSDIPTGLSWNLYKGATLIGSVNATASGKSVSVSASELITTKAYGDCLLVGLGENGYKIQIPVLLVTMKIDTKEALSQFATNGNDPACYWDSELSLAVRAGYYVLGANIDATDLAFDNKQAMFSGTFDGRGYTISGATYSAADTNAVAGGLLGELAAGSIVKNLALTNSKIYCHPYVYFGVLTGGATSFGTIDNCYVEIAETKSNVDGYTLTNMASGVVAHQGGGSMTNVVVKYASGAEVKFNVCEMVHGGATISNVYVIGGGSTNNGWIQDGSSASIVSITTMTEEQFSTFDKDIWALEEGVPCFKTAKTA